MGLSAPSEPHSTRKSGFPIAAPRGHSEDYLLNRCCIRLIVSDSELAQEISPRLATLHSAESRHPDLEFQVWTERGEIFLSLGEELIYSGENPNAIRAILLQEMVRRTERGREWLAVLHAAACGDADSCVLLAGKSHSGKTTLSAALMGSGLTFYCDDSAAIGREDGKVSPMPFRMMLRESSWSILQSRFPEIASSSTFERYGQKIRFLSPRPDQLAVSPGSPKALLFVSFKPGEKTTLRRLLPFEALLRLQESGFWVKHDRQSIGCFLDWIQALPAFSFVYSDLDDAILTVREISER